MPHTDTMIRPVLLFTLLFVAFGELQAQAPNLVRDFFPGMLGSFNNHGNPHGFRLHNGRLLLFAADDYAAAKLFALDDLTGNVEELA
jgi:hypothetical protein